MEANFNVSMNEYLPLRDVVFNTLRQAILRGELKPGERLMEIQLANKLGVSRTPVREALEELAARLACDKITKEGINRLKEAAQDFRSALKSNDITQMAEADVRFHDVICNATENQKLGQLLNNLREQMYRYRIEYLKDQHVYEKLLSEHEEIIRRHDISF